MSNYSIFNDKLSWGWKHTRDFNRQNGEVVSIDYYHAVVYHALRDWHQNRFQGNNNFFLVVA